ncbi:MAG TPA: PQQ-binding-like beta-propeller repeat protein [Gemmataceae bacterium]|nr:PQQ-binding-like beta-propeller repeat protein [Gemmataceae bacterium]
MIATQLKRTTIVLLILGMLTSSAVLIAQSNRDQDQAASANNQPAASATHAAQPAGKDRHGDPLPAGALVRIGTVRYRAGGGGINDAALSPDGKTLAAASEAGITLVDVATGRLRKLRDTLVPNGFDTINAKVAISANNKCAVNVTFGGNIRVYDLATGKFLRQFGSEVEPQGGGGIAAPPVGPVAGGQTHWSALWYPPHGRYLVASEGQRVHLLDLSTGDPQGSFEVAGSPTDVSADGKLVVSLNEQTGEAILYDQAGKELHRFVQRGMTRAMLCQAGKLLVTFDNLSNIRVWDTATGKKRLALPSPAPKTARPPGVAYATVSMVTPDGHTLLVGTQEGEVLRWNLATGKRLETWKPHYGWVTGLFVLLPPTRRPGRASHLPPRWPHAAVLVVRSDGASLGSTSQARKETQRRGAMGRSGRPSRRGLPRHLGTGR